MSFVFHPSSGVVVSSSPIIAQRSLITSFPHPPGKVHLLHGDKSIFPFSLTMAAHAIRQGKPIAVVDGANRFNVHLLTRFARERRIDPGRFLEQIYISRGFTCYQMEQAVVNRLPAFLDRIGSNVAMVFGLLDTFYDEQAPLREVRQILTRVLQAFRGMKAQGVSLLVVCQEQRVWPEERNALRANLKQGVDRVYRLEQGDARFESGRRLEVGSRQVTGRGESNKSRQPARPNGASPLIGRSGG